MNIGSYLEIKRMVIKIDIALYITVGVFIVGGIMLFRNFKN